MVALLDGQQVGMGPELIELATVIQELREELERAVATSGSKALRFELGEIELEMSVALDRSGHAGAKVRFWVVETGAETTVGANSTQRIKLALQPTLAASDKVFISGATEAHEE
ncbi:trypco2 family protein [Streptomyces sp. NPDC102467]|uniref:trypco2 family protein n=1 Tax=Streptomyces sp. NPDC102467 TaxID=3366179 RepID=UPI0038061E85